MRVDARTSDRDSGAEGGDLGQRKIHKNDAALHHVHAKIGVNAGQNQAGHEGREQKR